jgi:hypothetical protein
MSMCCVTVLAALGRAALPGELLASEQGQGQVRNHHVVLAQAGTQST